MNELLGVSFLNLLSESSQKVTNEETQNAYEKFTEQIRDLNQPDKDYATIYRTLNLTRIEFESLQLHFQYEQGEKCA